MSCQVKSGRVGAFWAIFTTQKDRYVTALPAHRREASATMAVLPAADCVPLASWSDICADCATTGRMALFWQACARAARRTRPYRRSPLPIHHRADSTATMAARPAAACVPLSSWSDACAECAPTGRMALFWQACARVAYSARPYRRTPIPIYYRADSTATMAARQE